MLTPFFFSPLREGRAEAPPECVLVLYFRHGDGTIFISWFIWGIGTPPGIASA